MADANEPEKLPPELSPLETPEAARNWIMELVHQCEEARRMCDVRVPDNEAASAQLQLKMYRKFLIRHGCALGAVAALFRARRIDAVAYDQLRKRVLDTLTPTVVGAVTR